MSRKKLLRSHRRLRRGKSKSWCIVYVLREREGGPAFYVGQTRQAPAERLRWHIKEIHRLVTGGSPLSPVQVWIASRLPALPVIEVLDDEAQWDITEAVWIDRLTRSGDRLLNVLSRVR